MKTKIELKQAINNLTRMNRYGTYTDKIIQYQMQLKALEEIPNRQNATTVIHSEEDRLAIEGFCLDKRFNLKD